jgi:hypothetical protein
LAIALVMRQAIMVSVASGRYGPCCSKLPIGKIAVRTWGRRLSPVVWVGIRYSIASTQSGIRELAF